MSGDYENKSQRHLMVVVEALAATPLAPQTTEELHRQIKGVSKDQVWRALQNLEAQGWAEKRGGGWAVSPRLTRLSERLRIDIAQAHHAYLAPPEVTPALSPSPPIRGTWTPIKGTLEVDATPLP